MKRILSHLALTVALCSFPALAAEDSTLQVPSRVTAGEAFSIPTSGSGQATLYIAGQGQVLKREIRLGVPLKIEADELHSAGYYLASLCAPECGQSVGFYVVAGAPASLSFMARPSRLPVGLKDGISGTVYPFDKFHNLVVQPQPLTFRLSTPQGPAITRMVDSHNGVAWVQLDSASKQGAAQFRASTAGISVSRVVEQVASDPCSLHMTASLTKAGVLLQTDPVRDCNGNPVPDGTIVTFTETHDNTVSTVDAPVKRDFARAQLPAYDHATFSVAAGVVLGNEIHFGGGH